MNKKSLTLIVLLVLVGITSGYVASTYAKYTSEVTATGSATVAKWAFEDDNDSQTFTVVLDPAVSATTLVDGKFAPGASGYFEIQLSNENSEVGVDFSVLLGSITGAPANLKFYSDSSFTDEITPGTTEITGQLAAGDATGLNVPIYWNWDYYTSDANDIADTTAGEAGATLTLTLTITGVQTAPSATAITSHID